MDDFNGCLFATGSTGAEASQNSPDGLYSRTTYYVASAMAYNFGYAFRAPYWRNYVFVLHSSTFLFLQLYITLVPGSLSCPCSVNCVNEDVVGGVTSRDPTPIQNPFNTTVMPSYFRIKLFFIIVGNTIAVMAQDYFIVDGVRLATRRRKYLSIQ